MDRRAFSGGITTLVVASLAYSTTRAKVYRIGTPESIPKAQNAANLDALVVRADLVIR